MKPDESSSAYLTRAQEYATALANIGEPMKEKDIVMLVISGLREEYHGLKTTALTRQLAFNELHAFFADHDYMLQKISTAIHPTQAFTAALKSSLTTISAAPPSDAAVQAVQQLAAQLGLQLQPSSHPASQPSAFYTNRSVTNRNNRQHNNRGRGGFNRNNGGNRNQFSWASNQNTVYGSCNRCGIGHLPPHCPNRDPATIRSRPPPSANFAYYRSQVSSTWLPDTGSSHHVAPNLSSFDTSEAYHGNDSLHVGNNKGFPILHIGSTTFHSPNHTFNLQNILHVPDIKQNLLSVQKFCRDNHVYFEFHDSFFSVKDKSTHIILLTGPSHDRLYKFQTLRFQAISKVAFSTSRTSSNIWHQRLGHPHPQLLKSMLSFYHLPLNKQCHVSFCESCSIGKSSKLHLLNSSFKSSNVLDLLFCDVWGPSAITSIEGHNYFLLCVDHYSKFMWIFPFKLKSEVFQIFKNFMIMVERQFNTKLKHVQTDCGGEFRNLSSFFQSLGIIHRLSCPHTSEQNGIVERRHRHVVETGLTLLAHSHVPHRFWNYAFDTVVYLINRMPSRTTSSLSPFQHLFSSSSRLFVLAGYSPDHHGYRCFDPQNERLYIVHHVRFNELCFPYAKPHTTSSTTPAPDPYISLYPNPDPLPTQTSHPPPAADTPSQTDQPSSDPIPLSPSPIPVPPPLPSSPPLLFTYQQRRPKPIPTTDIPADQPPTTAHSADPTPLETTTQPEPIPRQRPANLRPNPKLAKPYNASSFHSTTTAPDTEPTSFTVANTLPQWRDAMADEYSALLRNGTWTLVPRVPGSNIVDSKWVFKIKQDLQGAIQRYKARLLAKGFRQQPGIDYEDTFSPVVKATTIRLVLSLAVTQKRALRQLDVQNAFLHGDLKETVYLQQPQGFVDPKKPDHVCLLHKSLYGLKQAPRAWFHRLSTTLHELGFKGSKTDPFLFIYSSGGTLLYMLVYVDDIILTGNNQGAIDNVVHHLGRTFPVQDMGKLSYFLGIEIVSQGADILLSQQKYILELLQKAGLSNAKPVSSPISTSANLALNDSSLFDNPVKYRQVVGALQYATLTRPDITYAVNKVCQFMHSPTENHWSTVKRILRYLKGTVSHSLLIQQQSSHLLHAYADSTHNSLSAFSDADWAGCRGVIEPSRAEYHQARTRTQHIYSSSKLDSSSTELRISSSSSARSNDCRSTGGYAIYLGSNLVSWSARKQKTVSRSSTESEYKALADAVAELTWIQALLLELRATVRSPPTLWCDNLGATYLSANPVFHARTKHVEIDFHFVREKVARRQLSVQFITTDDQIADVFTKPLPFQRFLFLRSKLRFAPRP
ncbi:hypothetical protein OSB04_006244 [Centaurea solstitialis]|uniref:Integrase catalytic domain-containing protein n=1 Tax=Centaurea solstitialis TaxID=347529 RepID=A0AA38TJA8_9ASTR|nr:hypothetical protein OSB04_006244 [Centaurea solstitialis]